MWKKVFPLWSIQAFLFSGHINRLLKSSPGVSERPNFDDFEAAAAEATTSVPDFKTGESAGGLGKRMESQGPPTPPPSSSSPSQFSALWIAIKSWKTFSHLKFNPEAVFLVRLGTSSFPARYELYGKTTVNLVPSWKWAKKLKTKKWTN